jgi:hypothetical protein
MTTKQVSGEDLQLIYDSLLTLADWEGCTIRETLIDLSDEETAARIYDEVFS